MEDTSLSPTQQAIFDGFRSRFNDITYFNRLLLEPVRRTIVDIDTNVVTLNSSTAKSFTNKYISARKLPAKEDKALSVEINHIMCTLCVYMIRLASPPTSESATARKISELKEILAGLADYDDIECNLLVTFREVVETAVGLFPNKDNKARVLFIGHRLGGSNLNMGKYSTGGGQSRPTERRVRIYEYESGIFASRLSGEAVIPNSSVVMPAIGKRAREVIEISQPLPDAPEEVLQQYQRTMQMVAQYQETYARFTQQRAAAEMSSRPLPARDYDYFAMLPPARRMRRSLSSSNEQVPCEEISDLYRPDGSAETAAERSYDDDLSSTLPYPLPLPPLSSRLGDSNRTSNFSKYDADPGATEMLSDLTTKSDGSDSLDILLQISNSMLAAPP